MEVQIECPVLNNASLLPDGKLPIVEDILKFYEYIRCDKKKSSKIEPSRSDILKVLINDVKVVWRKLNIPLISDRQITISVGSHYDDLLKLRRRKYAHPEALTVEKDILKFKEKMNRLFDLSKCKCKNLNVCSCRKKN